MRDFPPGKPLPSSEANCDGWIEVTARGRGTGDDSKCDTNSKAPTDLKDAAKGSGIRLSGIEIEGSDGCDAGESNTVSVYWLCKIQKAHTHRRTLL